jgi:hypothetical protein
MSAAATAAAAAAGVLRGPIAALEAQRLLLLALLCLHCKGVVLVGELGSREGLPPLSGILHRLKQQASVAWDTSSVQVPVQL